EPWVFDTGPTHHFSLDSCAMMEYMKCQGRVLRCASGSINPIVGRGNLSLAFRSDGQDVVGKLIDVGDVPNIHHHLLSFTRIQNDGHTYTG
ncbi:unnamed protein product, partial [Sphacelaria rigidula]